MTTTLLVIDDSEDDQHLYRRAFKGFESSFNLVMASSTEVAFARIADAKPDLILLDYNLPDMDGLSFMKKLDKYSDTAIPIIMLTGEGNAEVAVKAMKNGVDDYIIKDTEGQYLRVLPGVVEHVMAAHAQREQNRLLQKETEALLLRNQALMQNSMDGIHVMDMQGNIVEANSAFCRMLGYTPEEMARLNVADWDAQWSVEELRERFKWLMGKNTRFETVHRRKDGAQIDVEISTSGMKIEGQHFLFATSHDITERKKANDAIRESENKFRILFESASDCIMILDMDGRIRDINRTGHERLGYSKEEMLGKRVAQFDPPNFAAKVGNRFVEIQTKGCAIFESAHVRKDGSVMPVEISARAVELNGRPSVLSIVRDITERKQTEEKLLKGEANLRAMLDNSPYLTWLKDTEGRYITINKVFADYLRLDDAQQAMGKTDLDLQPKELAEKYRADDAEVMAARQQKHVEESSFDGTHTHWVETFKTPIIDVHGKVLGTVGFARDITERKKAEEEIRLENETGRKRAKLLAQQFGQLLQNSFNEIYLFDAYSLRFLQVSKGAQNNLGYSTDELKNLTPLDLGPMYNLESFEELIAPLRNGEQQTLLFDTVYRRKDGTTYTVEVRLQLMESESPVFLAIVQDITEREKSEQNKRKLTRALQLLSECGTLLIHAKNEQRLLEDICQLAVATGGYLMAWVGFAENDAAKSVRPVAQSGYEEGYLDGVKLTWSDTKLGQGPTGTAIRTGVSVINPDCLTSPTMAPWREAAIKRGYRSSIALPLASNKHLFGALTIYSVEPDAFSHEEVALLEELANNLAFGIETLRTRDAHKRAEQESRELSAHLQTVREEEKASFAREIHDDLGGTLAALKMDAYWLANKLAEEKKMEPLHACALSMVGQLNAAVLATRRIITDLRPTLLDDLGLLEALRWQCAEFHKRTGIECRVVCTGEKDCEDTMDGTQAINLFRITQESLTNVVRHSGATKVGVSLRRDNEEVVLSISDNGRGLPEGHTIASTSYGLRGMRERVVQLGGKIKFDNPAGGGFSVTVRLPVAAATE